MVHFGQKSALAQLDQRSGSGAGMLSPMYHHASDLQSAESVCSAAASCQSLSRARPEKRENRIRRSFSAVKVKTTGRSAVQTVRDVDFRARKLNFAPFSTAFALGRALGIDRVIGPRGIIWAVQVIRARKMGFCFGVRRAFDKVMEMATQDDARELVLSGDLVHNTKVISRVGQAGARVMDHAADVRGARVVIRTHGTTRENFETLTAQNAEVHDATCVIVTDARMKALELLERHPAVIVVGKKQHPEIVGLVSWLEGRYHIVEHIEDIAPLPEYPSIGVVSQTTFYPEKFAQYCEELRRRYPLVEVIDTICPHTSKNQEASIYTAQIVDVMLVVGDQHSSNSKTLFGEVQAVNPRSYFIATAEDIDPAWFEGLDPAAKAVAVSAAEGQLDAKLLAKGNAPDDFNPGLLSVGITAGASTPDWVIDEIEARLKSF